jgi:hypothetical protein
METCNMQPSFVETESLGTVEHQGTIIPAGLDTGF